MPKSELFPLHKAEIMKDFGYISFQLILANVDVIGIRVKSSYEVVVITFIKNKKTGFIYETGNRSNAQNFKLFEDVPEDRNQLAEFEERMSDKIEILYPPKHNYVFVTDNTVQPIKSK